MRKTVKVFLQSSKIGEHIYHTFLDIKYGILQILPIEKRVKLQHVLRTKYKLNLENPKKMSDWINIQKLNTEIHKKMALYSDKYRVKEIVSQLNTDCKIINNLGVYETTKELENDLDKYEYPIVIKFNFGSGGTFLLKNKKEFKKIKKELNYRYNVKYSKFSQEMHYDLIDRKIIVEPYISGNLIEYKFYCSKGEILFYYVYKNIAENSMKPGLNPRCYYTKYDTIAPFKISKAGVTRINLSNKIDEIKIMAKKMSKDFDFVRIDFLLDGQDIYFGEYTFTSHGGYLNIEPIEYDYKIGLRIEEILNESK